MSGGSHAIIVRILTEKQLLNLKRNGSNKRRLMCKSKSNQSLNEQITNYIVKLERENFGLKEYKKHQEKANERRYHTGDESWHRGSVVAKKK